MPPTESPVEPQKIVVPDYPSIPVLVDDDMLMASEGLIMLSQSKVTNLDDETQEEEYIGF